MSDNNNGKVALITGASRGIGRAILMKFAESGYDCVFNYNRSEDEAKKLIEECSTFGVKVYAFKKDVSNPEECKELVEEAMNNCGRIDVLVNNAGISRDNLIMKVTDEELDKVLDVNLKGTFYMIRAVSRIMMKQRGGRIISISSIVGLHGNAGQTVYSASKAGIIGITKSIAKELASRNVTANAIAPGMIATDMTDALPDSVKDEMLTTIPLKRAGKPEDIAATAVFLASEGAAYITGQVIGVDGGMGI